MTLVNISVFRGTDAVLSNLVQHRSMVQSA